MKAIVYRKYGPPEVLHPEEVEKPVPGDNEILIRVRATTVTAGDWRLRKADPFAARLFSGLFRPRKINILGFEVAGDIESVGRKVERFKPGDPVFASCGFGFGGYAEYKCLPAENRNERKGLVELKPDNLTYEEAAAVPVGATSALGIMRKTEIKKGQMGLIYGASGSVGTYAVQLAKYYGAEVTGVCSTKNMEMVKSIGADRVIDYTKEDISKMDDRYDFIFDAVGKLMTGNPRSMLKKLLKPDGTYMDIEMSPKILGDDLKFLKTIIEDGMVKPVIDRKYTMDQIVEAHRYVEQKRKKGNVVITIQ